jgi:hypothetical protein
MLPPFGGKWQAGNILIKDKILPFKVGANPSL